MTPQDEACSRIADLTDNLRMRLLVAHETLMKLIETISVVANPDGSVRIDAHATLSLDEFKTALGE